LELKLPVVIPCGHSICKKCYLECDEPQENTKTECKYCNEHFDIKMDNVPLNYSFIHALAHNKGPHMVCDKHGDKEIEFYCKKDQVFLCSKCAFFDHGNHREAVEDCTK
jgi:hypothetical protein